MDIDTIVEQELRTSEGLKSCDRKGNVKRVAAFCEQSIEPLNNAGFKYNQEDYIKKIVRLSDEFFSDKEDSIYLRSRCEGNVLRFLNDVVLAPMTGLVCVKKGKHEYGVKSSKKRDVNKKHVLETLGVQIDTLALVLYLLDNYQSTLPKYRDFLRKKPFVFESKVFKEEEGGNGKEYCALFSRSFWRNLYHNVDTCKFNGEHEMVAAMLDCADKHIYYMLLMPKTTYAPAEIVAILVDAKDRKGRTYLIVEGVFGTPEQERSAIEPSKLMEFYYNYLCDCLETMAIETGRTPIINKCFSGHYPSQGPTDFVNFICKKEGRELYYELKGAEGKQRFKPTNNEEAFDMDWLTKEKSPKADKLFTSYRRLNTWFEWTKQQTKQQAGQK